MSTRSRGEDRQDALPPAVAGALSEWQALLEPTPAQLASSYQRVRETLAQLPPIANRAAPSESALEAGAAPQYGTPGRWRRIAADCRRAAWAISGGAALALLAGFALGRLSSGSAEDPPPLAPASPIADPAPPSRALSLSPPPPPPVELEPAAAQPSVAAELRDEKPEAAAAPRAAQPRRARRGESPPSDPGLCQRRDPVQRAECWLRREQPRQALKALCGAAPGAAREREQIAMLRLVAECKLGRDIRGRAQRFFAEWPDSPLALRIRNECPEATGSFASAGTSARAH
jgi:hypothetical protein